MNSNINNQHSISGFKTVENLNPRQSYQDGTEDDIVSFQDDINDGTSNIFMKNKELPFLEDDKSITVDNDYEDDNTINVKHNNSKKINVSQIDKNNTSTTKTNKKNPNMELMKYISDTSDFFERPYYNQNKGLITFSNNNVNSNNNEDKNYIDDDDIHNNHFNDFLNNDSNNKKNNPLFSSDGLGILQPLETKIQNNISLYTKNNKLQIQNFNLNYIGIDTKNSLMSTQSFGLTQSKIKEKEFHELENNYNQVLTLLKYWQQFYLDIAKLVKKDNNINNEETDFFSEDYRYSVIEDVKNLIGHARNKVYNYYEPIKVDYFNIISQNHKNEYNIDNNISDNYIQIVNKFFDYLEVINKDSFLIEKKITIKLPKILDYDDYYNEFPPLQFSDREKVSNKFEIKEKTNKNELIDFECQVNIIESKPKINEETNHIKNNKSNTMIIKNKKINNKDKLIIDSNIVNYNIIQTKKRGNSPSINKMKQIVNKKTNIITHSEYIQTDFTLKNIQNMEILNKECSIQLQKTQKEKDNIKIKYEKQISELNKKIEECNKESYDRKYSMTEEGNESQITFIPELIPPEQTYKIFMHSIKHFKYEETIYKKFMDEKDLKSLKIFVNKMDKYLYGISIPFQKPIKRNTSSSKIPVNTQIPNTTKKNTQYKKFHDNILNGIRPLATTTKNNAYTSPFSNGNLYSSKRNNSSFMKYKTAIKNIHDNI